MAVIHDYSSRIITVTIAAITTPAPTAIGIRTPIATAVIRRSPAPITTIVRVVPAAAPTEAPTAPTPTEAKSAAVAISIPRIVTIPRVEPRVIITHAGRIVVKAVNTVGVFAVTVFVRVVIVVISFIRIFIGIITIVGIFLLHSAFVVIIIRALVVHFFCLGIIIIDIVAECHLPRSTART